jgi:hypothetical protein
MTKARLVADLYEKHAGVPALIVGGGPSAPAQLAMVHGKLGDPIVISANGHAFKLGLEPDYVFCKDHIHTETKERMEWLLRPHGVPIVTRNYWGDYRCAGWTYTGNSGSQALALAALMGCAPIVPIGFDGYQNGTYFHDLKAKNVSQGFTEGHWRMRYSRLRQRLEGAEIRVLPGSMLAQTFPLITSGPYKPVVPVNLRHYEGLQTRYVRALSTFQMPFDGRVAVPAGVVFPVSDGERAHYLRLGVAEDYRVGKVDSPLTA